MRRRFAVALGAAVAALAVGYWQSGHTRGVEFVRATQLDAFGDNSGFGGISAIDFDEDAVGFVLTDRGTLFDARFGKLGSLEIEGARKLSDAGGAPFRRPLRDSEGLAILPDGRLAVSFEWEHRIEIFDTNGRSLGRLPAPVGFDDLQSNSGLEALAVDSEGRLLAIPERSGASTRPFPVFVYDGEWRELSLPRRGAFLPVGADFGYDGRLYLLERDYLLGGFRSRIRRFDWDGVALENEEEILKTRFGTYGNLEGISFTSEGFMSLVSDNNFLSLIPTELVVYRVVAP